MKKLLLRILLKDKFVGALASAVAATLSAYLISLLPGVPEIVHVALRTFLELPPGEITPVGLTAVLTPLLYSVFSALIQEYTLRENNKTLVTLDRTGEYPGEIDGLMGPIARETIRTLKAKSKK